MVSSTSKPCAICLRFSIWRDLLGPHISYGCVRASLIPHVDRSHAHTMRPSISVKTKVQQRAMAGEMYRSPGETFYRLIRGESSCFKCAASASVLNGEPRTRPSKSEIAHRGYRPHIPRPRCECVA